MSDFIPNKCLKLIKWQRWIKLDMFSVFYIIFIQMNINFYFSGVDVYPPLLKLYKKNSQLFYLHPYKQMNDHCEVGTGKKRMQWQTGVDLHKSLF